MNISAKIKNILWIVFAVVLVIGAAIWMFAGPQLEHIEDTNGTGDYSLQTITEQDVVEQRLGTKGSVSKRETRIGNLSNGIRYSSKKFTGVYRLYTATIMEGSDIYVSLAGYEIKEGNFAFYVVFDGDVVGKIEPDDFATAEFTLENVEKTAPLEYFIAGESASFEFITPTAWE